MTKKPDRPVLTKPAVSGSTVPRDVETTSASGARARALVRRTKDAVREAKKAKYGDRTASFSATADVNLKSNARNAHAALPADPARRRPRTPDATDAATTSSTADRGATVGRKMRIPAGLLLMKNAESELRDVLIRFAAAPVRWSALMQPRLECCSVAGLLMCRQPRLHRPARVPAVRHTVSIHCNDKHLLGLSCTGNCIQHNITKFARSTSIHLFC